MRKETKEILWFLLTLCGMILAVIWCLLVLGSEYSFSFESFAQFLFRFAVGMLSFFCHKWAAFVKGVE